MHLFLRPSMSDVEREREDTRPAIMITRRSSVSDYFELDLVPGQNFPRQYCVQCSKTSRQTQMTDAKQWETLNNSRHLVVRTAWVCRVTMEFAYGILLDWKFLCRCEHAAFVNTKWYETWSERILFVDPSVSAGSRGCKGNLVTVFTPDTAPLVKTHMLFRFRWSSPMTS